MFLVENSTWNNVGDGFYQFPIFYLLESMYGHKSHVSMIDGPIRRAFRLDSSLRKKIRDNAFDISEFYDGSFYVFSGPILGQNFLSHYSEFIKRIQKKGANYLILSCHSSLSKDSSDINEILAFLKQYPPIGVSTRDRYTFDLINPYLENCYDGICCAFYAYLLTPIPRMTLEKKYITLSFYKSFEPSFKLESVNGEIKSAGLKDIDFSQIGLSWKILRHFEFLRNLPSCIEGYKIVRPHHGIGTGFFNVDFSKPNSYLSFNPISYLGLYQNSSLTISDRVHACVAALAAGKPALFYSKHISSSDRRNLIFDRAPVRKEPETNFYRASLMDIESELYAFKVWLDKTINLN